MARILVLEDQESIRDSILATLGDEHEIVAVADLWAGQDRFLNEPFDLVIVSLHAPGVDPIALRDAMQSSPRRPVLLLASHDAADTAVEVMKAGAYDYLQKPFNGDELRLRVERCLEHYRLVQESESLRQSLTFVGKPLADVEKQVILSTLEQFKGHRMKTAAALGIGVRTLGMKLKRWREENAPAEVSA